MSKYAMSNPKPSPDSPNKPRKLLLAGVIIMLAYFGMQLDGEHNTAARLRLIARSSSQQERHEAWIQVAIDLIFLGIGIGLLAWHFVREWKRRDRH
jgi:hypothetical protein